MYPVLHTFLRTRANHLLNRPDRVLKAMNAPVAQQTGWFEDALEYEGPARASFSAPEGTVIGHARVEVTPLGDFDCTMKCESLSTPVDVPLSWVQFFDNGQPQPEVDGVQAMALHVGWNTCTSFHLEARAGVFEARSPIHFNYTVGTSGIRLQFRFPRSTFRPGSQGDVKYWVLPLCNFVNYFFPTPQPLAGHPLRIWVEPPVDLAADNEDRRKLRRWAGDRVIGFTWQGAPAFIERVPDYEERVEALRAGDNPMSITTVMVGEIGGANPGEHLDDWSVLWLLPVLSLACGNEVRAPWIELRAEDGQLVRRIHYRWPFTRFRAKDAVVTGGAGALLTGAPHSDHFGTPPVSACVRHLLLSSGDGSPLEDRLDHLSRALELLCRLHGLNTNEAYSADLPSTAQQRLADARAEVNDIANSLASFEAGRGLTQEQQGQLNEVARRLKNSFTLQVGFGKAVEALIRHYGLKDSDAVAPHFRQAPDSRPRRWDQALSRYRNTVIHHGYFEVDPVLEVYKFIEHLRDVLTRVLLKMVCYIGKYAVGTAKYSGTERPVGWVTSSTDPAALGYRDE
jgi:hypothetical protein